MKQSQFIALERQLLSELPDFKVHRRLLFIAPIDKLIRGLNFEGSNFDRGAFMVNVFVMPLCIPSKYLTYNFGHRVRHVRGGDRWNIEEPNLIEDLGLEIKRQAVPVLSRVDSLPKLAEVMRPFESTMRAVEAIGFSFARAGQVPEAIEAFDRLQEFEQVFAWHREVAERAAALKVKLLESPADAQKQLADWEAETIQNLGLQEYWKGSP